LDLAKNVFQVHGADASGAVLFRKKLRRHRVVAFFSARPPCTVATEACSSHHWAREIGKLDPQVRLIPPAYVNPFVKRQKNDAADTEAICEAAQRPTMRFVVPKSEQAQAAGLVFRASDLMVRRRSTGGEQKLGAFSKMGERTLRRPLIIGANSVLLQVARHGGPAGSWIARLVARKLTMLVRVALANKMARIVWLCWREGRSIGLQSRWREHSRRLGCWGVGRAKERDGATVIETGQGNQLCNRCREHVVVYWT
jgi:transposase